MGDSVSALTQPQRFLQAALGLDPSVMVSTPDYVSQYTQLPEHWEYDINPGSGNSRATYLGEVFCGGQAASNRVATQGDIAAATTGVSSFNTRTGAVTLTLVDVTSIGGAPINNTALQGNPTAATQPAGTSNTTLATTAFVTQALANQPGVYTWNGRQGAVTMTLSDVTAAGGAPIASPMFTGIPQAPTAAPGTDNQQLATTAFVMTQMGNSVVSWNGRVGNVTLTLSDVTSVGGAPINAPAFTGVATAVTPPPGTATQQLATTQFVTNAVQAATVGVASFNTRTGAVTLQAADISQAGGALLAGPALTGVPTAPTAPAATNTTQIATCAFVETALAGASVVSSFNTRTGAVTLSSADVANAGALMTAGGTMTGNLTLNGNASVALQAVPYQQLTSVTATLMPLAGGTFTGPVTLAGNATGNLQPVTLQQQTAALGNYVPLTGNSNIAGNIALGSYTVPVDAAISGQYGQIFGWNCDFANLGMNAYLDTTATTWRRSNASVMPAVLGASATAVALNVAAVGAIDSAISWTQSVAFTANGIAYTAPGMIGPGVYVAFGRDAVSNSGFGGISCSINGAGANNYYAIASLAVAGSYYAIIGESVAGGLLSCTGWTNGNQTFTWSTAASDRRLKHNLSPAIGDALATVNAIEVYDCDYQHPATDDPPERWDYTLVADEVQAHLPFAYLAPPDHENGYASLHPLHLIATLWKAVQQLTDRVATLEAARV